MIRAFLAVDLPKSYRNGLSEVQGYLKKSGADVRWSSVDNIHLTLKFFGDIDASQIEAIIQAAAGIARTTPPFLLGAEGVGAFPSFRNPRVIWLGLNGQTESLTRLHRSSEQVFALLGFPAEKRKFTPHLTLGRVRSNRGREQLQQLLEGVVLPKFDDFSVTCVVLYRSTLRPQGSLYTVLQEIKLNGDTLTAGC